MTAQRCCGRDAATRDVAATATTKEKKRRKIQPRIFSFDISTFWKLEVRNSTERKMDAVWSSIQHSCNAIFEVYSWEFNVLYTLQRRREV